MSLYFLMVARKASRVPSGYRHGTSGIKSRERGNPWDKKKCLEVTHSFGVIYAGSRNPYFPCKKHSGRETMGEGERKTKTYTRSRCKEETTGKKNEASSLYFFPVASSLRTSPGERT
jgi:hypothetical protein